MALVAERPPLQHPQRVENLVSLSRFYFSTVEIDQAWFVEGYVLDGSSNMTFKAVEDTVRRSCSLSKSLKNALVYPKVA